MPRPYRPFQDIVPGDFQGTHKALIETDLGWQYQEVTIAANSNASLNIILNSLRSSNVAWYGYQTRSSYVLGLAEVTRPTVSAVFLHATALSAGNVAIPIRLWLQQRV